MLPFMGVGAAVMGQAIQEPGIQGWELQVQSLLLHAEPQGVSGADEHPTPRPSFKSMVQTYPHQSRSSLGHATPTSITVRV